jgi:hypothetical protein
MRNNKTMEYMEEKGEEEKNKYISMIEIEKIYISYFCLMDFLL